MVGYGQLSVALLIAYLFLPAILRVKPDILIMYISETITVKKVGAREGEVRPIKSAG